MRFDYAFMRDKSELCDLILYKCVEYYFIIILRKKEWEQKSSKLP